MMSQLVRYAAIISLIEESRPWRITVRADAAALPFAADTESHDREHDRWLAARGLEGPGWLAEHLAHGFPARARWRSSPRPTGTGGLTARPRTSCARCGIRSPGCSGCSTADPRTGG